jgi:hypothetical protein
LRNVNASGLKSVSQVLVRKDRAVRGDQLGKRQIGAARDVSLPESRARLRYPAGEAIGRSDVDELLAGAGLRVLPFALLY